MAFDNLSDLLAEFHDDGELVRVSAEVDLEFEIAAIVDRLCKQDNASPAVLFENVKGHSIPVVANLLGSERRMCRVLQSESFQDTAERIAGLVAPDLPESWMSALKLVPRLAQLTQLPPKSVESGICQQVVKVGRDVNLAQLPIPHHWPNEASAAITRGQVVTWHPESDLRHVALTPLTLAAPDALHVHWTPRDEGWHRYCGYRVESRQMPIAIALGGDPVMDYAAMAPLPAHTDPCLFAGFLRNRSLDMVKCRTNDLEVPANAEIVIEGYVDTTLPLESAGVVATSTGFYRSDQPVPRMLVTAITHRANPIFPTLVCGHPPMEDFWMNRASERLFLPLIRLFLPEVVDVHMPRAGTFRHLLFVSIHKQFAQQARKVMNALWGLGPLTVSKLIVVVDDDVDVHDEEDVWFHVCANVHPGRDTVFCEGPADIDDHAAPVRGLGHKMGIDATRKRSDEEHSRDWPDAVTSSATMQDQIDRRWTEYGLDGVVSRQTEKIG